MARHGENIRKRGDGRWEARYRMFDANKGRIIYRSVYGSTYEEAKRKRAVIQAAGESRDFKQGNVPKETKTACMEIEFSQAAAEWLEEVSGKHKHSTYVKYRNIYKTHLKRTLGSYILSGTLNKELQEKISDHLSEKGLSGSMRRSICCVANQILAFAREKYSVCVPLLKITTVKPAKKSVEAFSKAEQTRILVCLYENQDKFKTAMLLCLYTGMRLGELCSLKWTDIDFKGMSLTVNRTVQRIAMEGYATKTILMETAPKSDCSKRTIPLTDETVKLFEGLKGERVYVFGEDKALEPRTMQYQFKKILREAGVNDRNFHILRHTFATNCVESGMDVKTLSAILGHSDVKITLNRYVHPTMDAKRKQLGLLPDFYGQIRGQVA